MQNILNYQFLGNSVLNYGLALGIFLASVIIIKIFKLITIRKLKKWAEKTATTLDDFLVNLVATLAIPFLYLIAVYTAIKFLNLPPQLDTAVNALGMGILVFFTVRLILKLITYSLRLYWQKTSRSTALEHSISGILNIIKFVVWSLALVFFLDNLGFKISTVIAGLGIGGVAIALAAQAVLGDLFSYFSIIFDRPFEIGDFIIIGDLLGTVEHIGIKTTRIRSLGGEQLVFSNSDLTNSRVRNYKRMEKRRVVFKLGVTYNTPLSKLKEMPAVIEKAIKAVKNTAFDRAHFLSYGDFNLIYEVVYYVLSGDYNKYMDIQQEINFAVKEEFERRKIEFAFPTHTVYLTKE